MEGHNVKMWLVSCDVCHSQFYLEHDENQESPGFETTLRVIFPVEYSLLQLFKTRIEPVCVYVHWGENMDMKGYS